MTVISQPTYKADTERGKEEFHSAKGEPMKIDGMYPEWRQVMPSSFVAETTIDLSYYSFLAKGSVKNFDEHPNTPIGKSSTVKRIATPIFQDGQLIAIKTPTGYATFDPVRFRDAYKQMQELGKKLGFSPIIKAQQPYGTKEKGWGPILLSAEHNGIKWQHVLMPIHRREEDMGKALPGDIILGEQPTIYGSEQDTPQNTGTFSLKENLRQNISLAANRKMKSTKLVPLCSCPTVLQMLGEKNVGVVTTAQTIRKMHTTHGLSEETIYTAIEKLDEPAYVFKDKAGSYVFIPGVIAKNTKGNDSDIEIPIILERAKDGSHYIASAYALDDFQKIESWIKNGKLVYAKTLQAQPSTNGAREVTPNFEHLVVGLSSTDNVLTGTDLVNFKFLTGGISDSFPSKQETSVSSPEVQALFQDGVLETANAIVTEPGATLSIKALHASPHNFRKFDTAYMSTGTGGQWYGWGLYFTRGEAAAKIYFEGFKRRLKANPVAYQVELNVNENELIDWADYVPESVVEKIIADNPDMPDFVKRNIRGRVDGAVFYRYLNKWQERIIGDMDEAPKATSLLLLKSGIKGIRHQDNKSWKGDNQYGDDHFVIFSGDDIKITAVNESGVWSMEEGWEDYTDPTATFSLRRSTSRNRQTLLSERERTLLQTADYINRQAQRTARVLGADTEAQRAGVHFAQATAIITALDKYIFSQDYITRGSAEYRKLRALRNYAEQYISVARKGKLPTRRATKDSRIPESESHPQT